MLGWHALVYLALAFMIPILRADPDQSGRGDPIFQATLLRLAELNPAQLGPFGTPNAKDRLADGKVIVRRKREVEIVLNAAEASQTYQAFFCPLGAAPSGCQKIGEVTTDRDGDATARLPFGLTGAAWSGVFVLTRDNANQFVSGFRFPTESVPAASSVELELSGWVESVGADRFRLKSFPLDILVTPQTRFEKVSGLSGLKPGDEVQVWAYTRSDGAVIATRVRLDDKPDPPGRAVGHGH